MAKSIKEIMDPWSEVKARRFDGQLTGVCTFMVQGKEQHRRIGKGEFSSVHGTDKVVIFKSETYYLDSPIQD